MKNIFLIPTQETTLLVLRDADNKLVRHTPITRWHGVNQYLYITSDEQIQEGDWVYHSSGYVSNVLGFNLDAIKLTDSQRWTKDCKKIIITTDQSLDGVQAIGDEFLVWYIKNPSCEYVEVKDIKTIPSLQLGRENGHLMYEINIPKENPTTTVVREAMKIVSKDVRPPKLDNLEERFKRDMSMVVMPLDNENIPEEEHSYLQGFINQFGTGVLGELDPNEWDALQFLEWLKLNNYEIIKKKK